MRKIATLALMFLAILVVEGSEANTLEQAISLDSVTDPSTERRLVRLDPQVTIPQDYRVRHAVLAFDAQVVPGQRIELWEDDGGEDLPWERSGRGLRRGVWLVGERSGSQVKFDITNILWKAIRESESLPTLLVRAIPNEEGEGRHLDQTANPRARIELWVSR